VQIIKQLVKESWDEKSEPAIEDESEEKDGYWERYYELIDHVKLRVIKEFKNNRNFHWKDTKEGTRVVTFKDDGHGLKIWQEKDAELQSEKLTVDNVADGKLTEIEKTVHYSSWRQVDYK